MFIEIWNKATIIKKLFKFYFGEVGIGFCCYSFIKNCSKQVILNLFFIFMSHFGNMGIQLLAFAEEQGIGAFSGSGKDTVLVVEVKNKLKTEMT